MPRRVRTRSRSSSVESNPNPKKPHLATIAVDEAIGDILENGSDPFGGGGPFGGGPTGDIQPDPVDAKLAFSVVGGLDEEIKYLRKNIIVPLMIPSGTANPEASENFARIALEPAKGVIFHGPPGTGKTLLAKTLAAELSRIRSRNVTFFMRRGTDLYSKWVGETENNLRKLFAKAEAMEPSLIFFDELDGLCPARMDGQHHHTISTVTQFLGLVDKVPRGKVFLIGATNRLSSLDPAVLRPGRFDKCLLFNPPNQQGRAHILNQNLDKWKAHKPPQELITEIAIRTPGFTGADLEQLIRNTIDAAIDRQFPRFCDKNAPMSDLTLLRVARADWLVSLQKTPKSNSNCFGNSVFTGEALDVNLKNLLGGILFEVKQIMETHLGTLRPSANVPTTPLGIETLLLWGPSNSSLLAINNILLPAVAGSLDTSRTTCFIVDSSKKGPGKWEPALEQALKVAGARPSLLFIPNLDSIWLSLDRPHQINFLSALEKARGKGLLILATAESSSSTFPEPLGNVFRGVKRELRVRLPTQEERKAFFVSLFDASTPPFDIKRDAKRLLCLCDKMVALTEDEEIREILSLQADVVAILKKSETERITPARTFNEMQEFVEQLELRKNRVP